MNSCLCIQILHPAQGGAVEQHPGGIDVIVQINLSCGCPTSNGGKWDTGILRARARAFGPGGSFEAETDLSPTSFTSELRGTLPPLSPGEHELEVEALDPESGLAGRRWIRFRVIPPPAESQKA